MNREPEPSIIADFRKAGGVVDYSFFNDVADVEDCLESAIQSHFAELQNLGPIWRPTLDLAVLPGLPRQIISKRQFFGDWYDEDTGGLRLVGSGVVEGKGKLTDPSYAEVGDCKSESWGGAIPDVGSGGQYAYAFSQTPYGLQLGWAETEKMFKAINELILPKGRSEITDWSTPQLGQLSSYFDAGLEWWGVFLFTIHHPDLRRLAIVSASTTD